MKPIYIYFNEKTQEFTAFEQGATIGDEAGVCVAKGVSDDYAIGFFSGIYLLRGKQTLKKVLYAIECNPAFERVKRDDV